MVDALAPQIDAFRTGANASTALGVLLPHLGFAYQEVGQVDKAVATFEEARKIAPNDERLTTLLIQALIADSKTEALAALVQTVRASTVMTARLVRAIVSKAVAMVDVQIVLIV
mgnify:CR=1 FL=1